ncbi:MAG TPA: NADP-dependent oxidoreductase [Lactobacillus sp.]|nr:NADP-dependent oxidoreductase [Lactobacillus sp.]
MKAFGYKTSGAPADVFKEVEVSTPTLEENDVLIDVTAFGLNHADAFRREGYGEGSLLIPGFDVAGIVHAVGSEVHALVVGDPVVAHVEGAGYAEQVAAPVQTTVKLPTGFPIADAAGLPTVAVTGYNALTAFGQVEAGQTVAILGASGGIGSIAIQFAKQLGASRVIGIAREEDLDYVRQLGADDVATYQQVTEEEQFANTADVVINVNYLGGHSDAMIALAKLGSVVATVGRANADTDKPNVEMVHIHPLGSSAVHSAMQGLKQLIDSGTLSVRIARRFPFTLAGVIAASELNENGHTDGRIIVDKAAK